MHTHEGLAFHLHQILYYPQDKFRDCGNVVYANVMRDDDGGVGFSATWSCFIVHRMKDCC